MKNRTVIWGLVSVVVIAVLTAASPSFAEVINVDFGGGNNYTGASANGPIASGTTWNYFTGGSGTSKLDLTNDSGVATTVDLAFGSSGWAGVGNGSTPNHLQGDYVYVAGTPGTLTISGLTPGGAYNIALITIPQASGLFATDFTINEITFRATDKVGAGSNVNGPLTFTNGVTHVLFSNVKADGSGVITVTVKRVANNGILCGLQIETSQTPPSTSFGVVSVDLGTLTSSNYVGAAANGPIASAGTTWNYFRLGGDLLSQWHLTNDTGVATTVDVTIGSGFKTFADNAPNYLQGDRAYTDGSPFNFKISGLAPGRAYNLALIAGVGATTSTDFSVGATTNNASGSSAGSSVNGPLTFTAGGTHALFSGIAANSNGCITFTTARATGSSFGILAGFQIEEEPPKGTVLIVR